MRARQSGSGSRHDVSSRRGGRGGLRGRQAPVTLPSRNGASTGKERTGIPARPAAQLAGETNHTLSAVVLSAVERELEAREWRKRMVARPGTDLGMEAATLIAESRAIRDRQLGSR